MSINRLGELLVRGNLISVAQLRKAQAEQNQEGGRLGYHLIKTGAIEETKLVDFMSKQYGVPAINLEDFEIPPEVIALVPKEICEKHLAIPVNRAGQTLIVAMCDPANIFALDDLKFLTGYNISCMVASEMAIRAAIEKYYAPKQEAFQADYSFEGFDIDDSEVSVVQEQEEDLTEANKEADTAPIVKLVNQILMDAINKHASDIHVEPYEKEFRVRFRVDGVLTEVVKPPMNLKNAIISRLKIMAELDISERRLPQDGRIKLKMGGGREMDFRVSVCPTLFGEKVVLRLLDKSNLQVDMTKLGFEPQPLEWFKEAIDRPYGMVLVTGPTGSGKTTTLYSALTELNQVTDNVSTAEDPVEFNFAGINQVQMHESIGLNFAAALRSFLRQDPDVIMIGEIRDFETAEIAIKAALTGHMVLSTLHTNDAPSTISRMLNMGIEPFMVTASVNLILAQRLARRLCPECKKAIHLDDAVLLKAGLPPEKLGTFQLFGKGDNPSCPKCGGRGYKGRIALFEVMPMWDGLKELVINGASSLELKQEAIRLGMQTLRMAALNKMVEGVTSMDEVVGNTAPDST